MMGGALPSVCCSQCSWEASNRACCRPEVAEGALGTLDIAVGGQLLLGDSVLPCSELRQLPPGHRGWDLVAPNPLWAACCCSLPQRLLW